MRSHLHASCNSANAGFYARVKAIFPIMCFVIAGVSGAAETEPARYPGVAELQLGTDVEAIRPGEEFTVGLLFRHEPKYHTYWAAPGIVGVGATVEWELPEGFEVGEMQWPAPQRTKMATWTAYGYETDTCILIPVRAPKKLSPEMLDKDGKLVLKGQVGWMACATTCHPGWHNFELKIPVAAASDGERSIDDKWRKLFKDSRKRFPKPAPKGWNVEAKEKAEDVIQLIVRPPSGENSEATIDPDSSEIYFYCHDNQVDSHQDQKVEALPDGKGFSITLSRPDYGPKAPGELGGVLYRAEGWPGLDRPWMNVSAPW